MHYIIYYLMLKFGIAAIYMEPIMYLNIILAQYEVYFSLLSLSPSLSSPLGKVVGDWLLPTS